MADEQILDIDEAEVKAQQVDVSDDATDVVIELEKTKELLAQAQDQSLRMAADLQNARRRAEQDIEKAHKFSLEKIVNDLLPIIDSLERGLEMSDPANNAVKSVRDGMELTLKLFQDTLVRYKVEAINPQDQIFNPELHQAMSMQSDAEKKPNTILQVFQKGYLLNGRLLRPAMVVVNKV